MTSPLGRDDTDFDGLRRRFPRYVSHPLSGEHMTSDGQYHPIAGLASRRGAMLELTALRLKAWSKRQGRMASYKSYVQQFAGTRFPRIAEHLLRPTVVSFFVRNFAGRAVFRTIVFMTYRVIALNNWRKRRTTG